MSFRKNSDASVFTSIQAWCKEWALLKTPPRRDAGLQFQQRLVLAGSWVKTILNACSPTCLRFAGTVPREPGCQGLASLVLEKLRKRLREFV